MGHQRRVNFKLMEGHYCVVCKLGGCGDVYLDAAVNRF